MVVPPRPQGHSIMPLLPLVLGKFTRCLPGAEGPSLSHAPPHLTSRRERRVRVMKHVTLDLGPLAISASADITDVCRGTIVIRYVRNNF